MGEKTAAELIKDALEDSTVLGLGRNPSNEQNQYALGLLNDMLDLWSEEGLIIPSATLRSFSLVAGTASYSIGSGQTFDTARPIVINSAFVRDSANSDFPVQVLQSDEDYNRISPKSTQGRPYCLRYRDSYPYGSLYLYYTPDSAYTLYLDVEQPLTQLAIDGTMQLPGPFNMFVRCSLADMLCSRHGKDTPKAVLAQLRRAEKAIMRRNVQVPQARFDPALTQRQGYGRMYDINSGT